MRNGASDYLRKSNLSRLVPALLHAVEACETRRARERADQELGESKQRLRELAQHLQASIEQERAAISREIHDDVGGSLTALKFDLAWIGAACRIDGDEGRVQLGAGDGDARRSSRASASCTTCARPSWSRGWWPRCNGSPVVSKSAAASSCALRTPRNAADPADRRAAGGLPRRRRRRLTNITKHAHASQVRDRPVAGRRRAVARDQRRRLRPEPGGARQGALVRHPRPARTCAARWAAGST